MKYVIVAALSACVGWGLAVPKVSIVTTEKVEVKIIEVERIQHPHLTATKYIF